METQKRSTIKLSKFCELSGMGFSIAKEYSEKIGLSLPLDPNFRLSYDDAIRFAHSLSKEHEMVISTYMNGNTTDDLFSYRDVDDYIANHVISKIDLDALKDSEFDNIRTSLFKFMLDDICNKESDEVVAEKASRNLNIFSLSVAKDVLLGIIQQVHSSCQLELGTYKFAKGLVAMNASADIIMTTAAIMLKDK